MLSLRRQHWTFIGEGRANAVFSHNGRVLRFGKVQVFRKFDCQQQVEFMQQCIFPLFRDHQDQVLHCEAVEISRELISVLDLMLQSQHRDSRFVGQRLDSNETHASRMPLLRDDRGRALLEFKPKWLAQSPDAPADAIVCRTCAVRRMRSPSSASGFCPLDLISLRRSDVDRAVQALSAERSWRLSVDSQSALAKLLYQNPLLMHLKKLQQEARDQALAMTLRDCSAYVDLEKGCIILGDLDRKHSDKRSQWAATEHELREGAFYYGQPCPMLLGS